MKVVQPLKSPGVVFSSWCSGGRINEPKTNVADVLDVDAKLVVVARTIVGGIRYASGFLRCLEETVDGSDGTIKQHEG